MRVKQECCELQSVTPFSLGFLFATELFPLLSGLFIRSGDLFSLGQPGPARLCSAGSTSAQGALTVGVGGGELEGGRNWRKLNVDNFYIGLQVFSHF